MKMKLFNRALGVAALLLCGAAGADQFGAMPGLWKTTFEDLDAKAPAAAPQPRWHCADEQADPWLEYAQLREPKGYSCKRVSFERTLSTLKWKLACEGPSSYTSEGSLVFDSPKHYSGTVTLGGMLQEYPWQTRLKVEGNRVAACTSPSD
jgi:hypothetical protein